MINNSTEQLKIVNIKLLNIKTLAIILFPFYLVVMFCAGIGISDFINCFYLFFSLITVAFGTIIYLLDLIKIGKFKFEINNLINNNENKKIDYQYLIIDGKYLFFKSMVLFEAAVITLYCYHNAYEALNYEIDEITIIISNFLFVFSIILGFFILLYLWNIRRNRIEKTNYEKLINKLNQILIVICLSLIFSIIYTFYLLFEAAMGI